jgi:6-phosphogluconolactonase
VLTTPRLEVLEDEGLCAGRGAELIAERLATAVAARGHAALAVSGGRTPTSMFEQLARETLPWARIDVFQVDERLGPDGDPERNAGQLERAFDAQIAREPARFHFMDASSADPAAAAVAYEHALRRVAGTPPILDLVHLGLGADGHTASIFPGETLDERRDVAVTGEQHGRRRMTLTRAVLNQARSIVWLVTGSEKAAALAALVRGDPGLVASGVRRSDAVILADAAAAARVLNQRGLA